ncbi:NAD(P)/FAD-dependent oxidoreductase [Streptomyces sp. NPDC056661]|uniref:NAD(P)/FAD-dependent oxidoreductase n=1 Tax=Streptomyces sp. NPDC056661 TaxID=3345898 RepID=UPI003678F3AB
MTLSASLHKQRQGQAVVLGAGVAGLLAARALSERFRQVVVIDRDLLPSTPMPRKGVPQSRQLHVLLARGAAALDELFPGFLAELAAAGAVRGDNQADVHWHLDGHLLYPKPSGLIGYGASRPLIEHLIRARVAELPGVKIVDGHDVLGLVTDESRERVTAVRVLERRAGAAESSVTADLVVDACGQGSRASQWLRQLGYQVPPESHVRANVVYVTRHYHRPPDQRQGAAIVPFPGLPRGGAVVPQEQDRYAVVLFGLLGDEPPMDDEGMLAYAHTLAGPDAAHLLRSAAPLDQPVRMRYPASVRRYYEKLNRHLGGFLVIGDALCSVNPTYGQGMTVAALEALLLRKLLAQGTHRLPQRFFRQSAKTINDAWSMAAGSDLRFPAATGKRSPGHRALQAYLAAYRYGASIDPVLGERFVRVANLIDRPGRLLTPATALRVLRTTRHHSRRHGPDNATWRA